MPGINPGVKDEFPWRIENARDDEAPISRCGGPFSVLFVRHSSTPMVELWSGALAGDLRS